jgi:hypothetical protein
VGIHVHVTKMISPSKHTFPSQAINPTCLSACLNVL